MNNHERIKQAFDGVKAPGRLTDAILNDSDLFEPFGGEPARPAQTGYAQSSARTRLIGTLAATCMLIALLAVPVWFMNENGVFDGKAPEETVFAPGMETDEDDAAETGLAEEVPDEIGILSVYDPTDNDPVLAEYDPANLKFYAWELLDKYVQREDSVPFNAFIASRDSKFEKETVIVWGGVHYADLPSALAALEGAGFLLPAGLLEENFITATVMYPIKSDTPVREWKEEGYVLREYEIDMDIVAGYSISIGTIGIGEKKCSLRADLTPGLMSDGWSELLEIEGWETAAVVYSSDDELLPFIDLYLTNPIPDEITVPHYGIFPAIPTEYHSVRYSLFGVDGYTLEELIALAEIIGWILP